MLLLPIIKTPATRQTHCPHLPTFLSGTRSERQRGSRRAKELLKPPKDTMEGGRESIISRSKRQNIAKEIKSHEGCVDYNTRNGLCDKSEKEKRAHGRQPPRRSAPQLSSSGCPESSRTRSPGSRTRTRRTASARRTRACPRSRRRPGSSGPSRRQTWCSACW